MFASKRMSLLCDTVNYCPILFRMCNYLSKVTVTTLPIGVRSMTIKWCKKDTKDGRAIEVISRTHPSNVIKMVDVQILLNSKLQTKKRTNIILLPT